MRTGGALVAAALLLPACAPGGGDAAAGRLSVFAAASLSDVVAELGTRFERSRPGVEVVVTTGGSSALARQAAAGAPADVLATASPEAMALVPGVEPEPLARNALQVVVPRGNPGGVAGLADLARPELVVALCAPEVPCGAAAGRAAAAAGVELAPDTLEQDVRAALAKVRLGEVDAALVYRTDVLAGGDEVTGIDLPAGADATVELQVAVLDDARDLRLAQAFVALLLSADGQEVLGRAGFAPP